MVFSPVAVPVPYQHVDRVLPRALPFLRKAVQRSEGWEESDIEERVLGKKSSLWIVLDDYVMIGAALVELHEDSVYVALVGGNRWAEWRGEIKRVEEWARSLGIGRVEFEGRRGWERLMKPDGYVMSGGKLVKDLRNGRPI